MNNRRPVVLAFLVFVAIVLIGLIVGYNRLVKLDEGVKLSWGNLQNAYQRRLDLVPNLVSVVKASSDFEKQTLDQVSEARAKAAQLVITKASPTSDNFQTQEKAQAEVVASMNRLIGVIEKYPTLKATKSYLYLQTQLEGTERRIKVARSDFNASVASFNTSVRGFPLSLFAGILGFHVREGFQSESGSELAPEIKF